MYELIELFFFAYRDFVGDADRLLEAYGFGRAHHRVLYFVTRRPGLTIAELLEILRITKQSLNRVLAGARGQEFHRNPRRRPGPAAPATLCDARRRAPGAAARAGADEAVRHSAGKLGETGPPSAQAFLNAMIDPADRAGRRRRPSRTGERAGHGALNSRSARRRRRACACGRRRPSAARPAVELSDEERPPGHGRRDRRRGARFPRRPRVRHHRARRDDARRERIRFRRRLARAIRRSRS